MSDARRTRWFTIDEDDPSITYTGNWTTSTDPFNREGSRGGFNVYGRPQRGAQRWTATGGTLSVSFRGTQLYVSGTSLGGTPSWTCAVNGVQFEPVAPWSGPDPINRWALCAIALEDDGPHTFELAVRASTLEGGVYFDSISILPSYDLRDTLHPTVRIPSTDPAVRFPSGSWSTFDGVVRLTSEPGATARVDFNGTKAAWLTWLVGDYGRQPSSGTYTVGDGPPTAFQIPGYPADAGGEELRYRVLFETPTLPRGAHRLDVTYDGPSIPLVFDYLLIEDGDIFETDAALLPADPPAAPAGGGDNGTAGSGANPERAQDGPAVAAIVGGVVGGVAALALALALFLFLRLRRRRREAPPPMPTAQPRAPPVMTSAGYDIAILGSHALGHSSAPRVHQDQASTLLRAAGEAGMDGSDAVPATIMDGSDAPREPL